MQQEWVRGQDNAPLDNIIEELGKASNPGLLVALLRRLIITLDNGRCVARLQKNAVVTDSLRAWPLALRSLLQVLIRRRTSFEADIIILILPLHSCVLDLSKRPRCIQLRSI